MKFMFELSIALKYLIPRKKQLSVSLISLLSIAVISLVVWLVLVFLSVTEGIEKGWLRKLTTLNAPLKITPTERYYSSYYYQIDSVSSSSQFTYKTIAEKAQAPISNPYNPNEDGELPARFPLPDLNTDSSLKDPVKGLLTLLQSMQKKHSDLIFQDFEIGGALLRLQLLRPNSGLQSGDNQGYLTQVSYLASIPDKCPDLTSLLLPPSEKDLNHLLYLSSHATELARQDRPALASKTDETTAQNRLERLLQTVKIQELKPRYPFWQLPFSLLPEKVPFIGVVQQRNGKVVRIDIPLDASKATKTKTHARIWKENHQIVLETPSGNKQVFPSNLPLIVDGPIRLNVSNTSSAKGPLFFQIETALQNAVLSGEISWEGLEVSHAQFAKDAENWSPKINEEKESGIFLAKSFLDNGVLIGDRGYLSYTSSTSSSLQEHRLPIYVAGFYDPGIFSVGNKCILVPPFVVQTINASSSSLSMDKTQANGMSVWFKDLERAEHIKSEIIAELSKQGLDSYWKVTTFREYDFAKDLLQQFQSDKYLFALVGIIILLVACCNIISLLILLVNDKRREIGILQAMGASRLKIATIFGICGTGLGVLASLIGSVAALVTLRHIDAIVQLLSLIQGREAFNAVFFGKSLPSELSHHAVLFILIATPLLSLLAGLIPAIKACRLRPSALLRSE